MCTHGKDSGGLAVKGFGQERHLFGPGAGTWRMMDQRRGADRLSDQLWTLSQVHSLEPLAPECFHSQGSTYLNSRCVYHGSPDLSPGAPEEALHFGCAEGPD
jgi:hypothetical protein